MTTYTTEDFKRWGKRGPKMRKKNRTLTRQQSLAMLKAREANRKPKSPPKESGER